MTTFTGDRMSAARVLASLALTVCLVGCVHAQAAAPTTSVRDPSVAALQRDLPTWMEQGGVPGLAIAVVRDGRTEWVGSFGVADKQTARPVGDGTLFGAASLSKTVFAYAVLKLVDAGKLDLDAPLSRYYPDRVAADPRLDEITARIVLSHRTGFPNWRPNGGALRILFTPGERFSYSGEGVVYLQRAVEVIEGKPLDDVMRALVFEPLGMTRSSYVMPPSWAADAATGYTAADAAVPLGAGAQANAAASLVTTARDYARFLEAVLNGQGLKPATLLAMERPQVAVDPTCTNCTDRAPVKLSTDLFWGLGWGIEQNASGKYLWHWGDNRGFKAYVVADPNRRSAVVMFDNSDTGLSVASAVVQTVLGGAHPSFEWLGYDTYDSPNMRFTRDLAAHGTTQAVRDFASEIASGRISERALNSAGYMLLQEKQYASAIALFQRNVELHPTSSNVYDSLGEAYMNVGDTALAIRNYEKALALNPNSSNAAAMLAKLRGTPASP
jgi:CubicO group peptidase (beta-lactamase class C family)